MVEQDTEQHVAARTCGVWSSVQSSPHVCSTRSAACSQELLGYPLLSELVQTQAGLVLLIQGTEVLGATAVLPSRVTPTPLPHT